MEFNDRFEGFLKMNKMELTNMQQKMLICQSVVIPMYYDENFEISSSASFK